MKSPAKSADSLVAVIMVEQKNSMGTDWNQYNFTISDLSRTGCLVSGLCCAVENDHSLFIPFATCFGEAGTFFGHLSAT